MKNFLKHMEMLLIAGLLCILFGGCSLQNTEEEREMLDFVVMGKEVLPDEVLTQIEQKKGSAFSFTYADGNFLYIAIGYGSQKGEDYSIAVESCEKGTNAIYVDTTLLGPEIPKSRPEGISYPYIVLRTAYYDLPVLTS